MTNLLVCIGYYLIVSYTPFKITLNLILLIIVNTLKLMAMAITEYSWWGSGNNEPPSHLKTTKQLAEMGLKPIKAVGVILTKKYHLFLYDPTDLESAKPKRKATEKQLNSLAKGREKATKQRNFRAWWEYYGGQQEYDRVLEVRCARECLENKHKYVILDTETTGLYDAEIVEIAIINLDGEPLLNTLIKPTISIPKEASDVHKITDDMVSNAPSFPEIHPLILQAIEGKITLIYNKSFDISILNYCRKLHKLPSFKLTDRSECLMDWYSTWYGEWSTYYNDYKWQPLGGGHRALDDCLVALGLLHEMAKDNDLIQFPDGEDYSEFIKI